VAGVENGFQYVPLISVEFSRQEISLCNIINMIVASYRKILMIFYCQNGKI